MSPIVSRNRMRTRSVSRADASDISMTSLRHQHPRQPFLVDDDTNMTKKELAKTIAEFRVGYSPSSTNESTGVVNSVDDIHADEPKQVDTHIKYGLAPVNDRSLTTSPPVIKDKCYEASTTPPVHHTQTSTTIQDSSQATQPVDNESASLEERTSRSSGSHRRGFTSSEIELLEAAFHIADNPGTATMKLLVHLTGLDKKKIRGWFRTRRIRQERAKVESSENTTPSMTEPKHQVPPQYWPEPLRFSHMQRSYPVPGYNYRAPPGLPQMASGVPSMIPGIPSKVQPGYLYPPLPPATAPTMGFLPPPPPGHWYPPLGFNTRLPPQPTITKDGPLSSSLPAVSQATLPTGTPKVPTGPWYPSSGFGHPLQGVIPPTVPTLNAPSGLLPGGLLHPWSSVGCYAAPGVASQHPSVTYPPHPAVPYSSPWNPMLPAPNTQTPARQSGIHAEASTMNIASTSQSVKPVPSKVTCTTQEVSETDSEESSSA